ncbi:NLR family CARD domain-containing protein 3-like [Acropora muricata]|uniref:NLR family CARD domain-containing protein 3-like n=1 Tax=Acropora muricata TaxID=159855 RepID=UPI0034E5FDA2
MAFNACPPQEHDPIHGSSKLQLTILASEWRSSKGGLSTVNRELAIQLAKFSCVEVTFFLPKCSDEDKKVAAARSVSIRKAVRRPGYHDELDWLSFPPEDLRIDVVVGHGVKLGRQAQFICKSHKCKWVQIVHTDPEELGMFKCYENPISRGEQKHHDEVELCQLADFVVGIGPKLSEAFCKYLGFCKRQQDVFEFIPGVFDDFSGVQQVPDKRKQCSVLVFGRGDPEDFKLKGFDIAARSVAALSDTILVFVGAPHGKHEEIAKRFIDFGIPANRLRVRGYMEREAVKQLFYEVDLVLMPSRTEGFGVTGLESLSAGLPVLVSKNSGFGEALGSVPFGSSFVIDSDDPSTWTAAIKGIWNRDRKSQLDEVKAVRCLYGERYSWSKQCKHLIGKMFKVVEGTSSVPKITAQAVRARELKLNEDFTAARTSCPSHVIEEIRQIYQKCEGVIFPVPWCDEYFRIEDIFTRLSLVSEEKTRGIATTKEVTNMTSIFTPHECCEQPLTVLIEGEPGMGKTTYCQKLAFDWASKQCGEWDESFPRIDVVLLLRCRGIKSTIRDAIEEQILPDEIDPKEKEMFFQFLKENPSKLLLVLDGLDEVDPPKLEIFLKLVQRKHLPGCYIVLTSRHEAASKVRPFTDTLLEIVGFTTIEVECYIRKYFQHKEHFAEALISKVKCDLDLRELTKNPLNNLLLCVIFEDLEGILPSNRTQLYLEIVLFILRRYESKNGLSNRGQDLLLVYQKELMILGEAALDCLRKQELYFDDQKGDIKKHLLKFGFLSIQYGGIKRAPCDRYGFFHKSFQEFFSAYFLAFSIIDDVTKYHSMLTDEIHMGHLFHVFKFMSGIAALRSEETAVSIVQSIASILNETGGTSGKFLSNLTVAHELVKECKNFSGDLYMKLVRTLGESLELLDVFACSSYPPWVNESVKTFFEALAFNSTVSSLILRRWHFSIYHSEITNLLAQALKVNTSLSSLCLTGNSIDAGRADLLAQGLRANTSLSFLNLSENPIRDKGASSLAQALRVNTSLSSLGLRDNCIGMEGASSLAQGLRVNTFLSSLNLSQNSIGDEGTNSLAQALRVNTSLSSLVLSWNSISNEGANSVAQTLTANTSLSSLDLSCNSIGDEGAHALAQALKVNASLSSLDLSANTISYKGVNSLVQALKVNTSLTFLDLSRNSSGCEEANSLIEVIRVKTSLSSLDLADYSVGYEEENSLAPALRVNTSLFSLDLSRNNIGDEGTNVLAQVLRVCTSLSSLKFQSNSIGAAGANSLAQALKVNTSLSSLDLANNFFGSEGANSLAQAFGVNSSLSSLDLDSTHIGDEGANSLAQALRVNTSLSSLNLHYNIISWEGANSLAQALKVNTSLSFLDLSTNSVGDEGANSLAQALRVNTSLSSLNLHSNNIGWEGGNSLALALRVNTSLSSLDLSHNSIGDENANSLAQALKVNTSLSSLRLRDNCIGNKGANSLAQGLRVNTFLSSLNLSGNSIGDKGANSLAQALRVNTSLSSLDLSYNAIDYAGESSLAEALRLNTSLSLDLSKNLCDDEGANSPDSLSSFYF